MVGLDDRPRSRPRDGGRARAGAHAPESSRRNSPNRCCVARTRCAGTWRATTSPRPACSTSSPQASRAPSQAKRRRTDRSRRAGDRRSRCRPARDPRAAGEDRPSARPRRRDRSSRPPARARDRRRRTGDEQSVSDELDLGGAAVRRAEGRGDPDAHAAARRRSRRRFPRAVRDIAAAEGKDVELVIHGDDTELDRVILESLAEPLVHMVRNAVGHGIETAERARARRQAARARPSSSRAEQRGRHGRDRRLRRRARRLARAARRGASARLARRHPCPTPASRRPPR